MKQNRNNTCGLRPNGARGFTLIEMIGVLAVIAILAALLIPKVFNAINDAKVNGTVVGVETVKTALVDHYGKAGRFDQLISGATPNNWVVGAAAGALACGGYDTNVLTAESLMDKPFFSKIGTNASVQCRVPLVAGNPDTANAAYSLSGSGTNEVTGQYVLEAVISGVAETDAQALSQRIDGPQLSTAIGTDDTQGRVKYAAGSPTTVYIYITHR
jgi:prepilin-type N-terminal cleavage/methylation domain-containing protein